MNSQVILTILFISCNNGNKEAQTKKSESDNKETFQEKNNKISTTVRDSIIKNLQGEWREHHYPFRMVHFKNTTVKFTEEGVVEEPTFQDFNILEECPFVYWSYKKSYGQARQEEFYFPTFPKLRTLYATRPSTMKLLLLTITILVLTLQVSGQSLKETKRLLANKNFIAFTETLL